VIKRKQMNNKYNTQPSQKATEIVKKTDCDIQETMKLYELKLLHFKIHSFHII